MKERECTHMAHNCRVITNILKTDVGGCLVGSLCVKCDISFQEAEQMQFQSQKRYLFKRFNLGKSDEVAY